MSMSYIRLGKTCTRSVPAFGAFFGRLSTTRLSRTTPPSSRPRPGGIIATVAPIGVGTTGLLLLFVVDFSSLVVRVQGNTKIFLRHLYLIHVVGLVGRLYGIGFTRFIYTFLRWLVGRGPFCGGAVGCVRVFRQIVGTSFRCFFCLFRAMLRKVAVGMRRLYHFLSVGTARVVVRRHVCRGQTIYVIVRLGPL